MSQPVLPKVSVGVPVYNGAPYIRDSLEALAAQTYKNFEVVISDNCSTDETESICRAMAEKDTRFRYIRQENNLGLLGNFDFLLKHSDGDYFCWRAHDDLSDENFIAVLAATLDECPEAGMAVTTSQWDDLVADYSKCYLRKDTRQTSQYLRIRHQLLDCVCFWFYHLYRREELLKQWPYFCDEIGLDTMHCDILFMVKYLTAGKTASAPGAVLNSRRVEFKPDPFAALPIEHYQKVIAIYRRIVRENFAQLRLPFWQKFVLKVLALRYPDRRVVRLKPYFRRKIRSYFTK